MNMERKIEGMFDNFFKMQSAGGVTNASLTGAVSLPAGANTTHAGVAPPTNATFTSPRAVVADHHQPANISAVTAADLQKRRKKRVICSDDGEISTAASDSLDNRHKLMVTVETNPLKRKFVLRRSPLSAAQKSTQQWRQQLRSSGHNSPVQKR